MHYTEYKRANPSFFNSQILQNSGILSTYFLHRFSTSVNNYEKYFLLENLKQDNLANAILFAHNSLSVSFIDTR